MRVSLEWLKEFLDIDLSVDELCERLDMTGTKVEAVHTVGAQLDGVVVGQVLTREQHPNADKLSYCSVDVGASEPLRIVCGADNFAAADKVAVACVGATLPGGLVIKRAKLRGLESEGMLCSATELQVGTDSAGILVLPEDAPVGASFAEYRGLADTVLELEVTPNRPDCLSMLGVAREVAAITGVDYRVPTSTPVESGTPADELASISIAELELCPRYTARVIRGVTIGPSPAWLAERVTASGARPINNVVDITNYVLYELGQPLHAFDLATLAKEGDRAAIVVRTAEEGERLTTLDRQDRVLASDTLVIADPSGAVALAGVMGGEATEVSDTTHDILLESACFDPRSISRTSRRLSLISEASLRFERGVDPELALRAVDRAAELLVEVAGGTVAPGVIDVYPGSREPCRIELRTTRVNGLLGTSLTTAEIIGILGPLGIETLAEDDVVIATVPAFRPDLEREVDLIEEVARIWGMERIASTLPGGRERVGGVNEVRRLALGLTASLLAVGLDEHIGYSAGDPRDLERLGWELASDELLVEIINPMSEEQAVLRWTLLGSLLRAASHNQRRGVAGVRLFEVGSVFTTANGRKQPKERMVVSGVLAGAHDGASWYGGARAADVFDATAAIEGVMGGLHLAGWSVRAADRPWLQSGRSGEVILDGDVVGWVGEISAGVLDSFGLAAPAVAFELSATALGLATRARSVRYREIPRFPAVSLDVALIVPDELPSADVQRAIQEAGGPLLESVHLFDVYRDPDEAGEGERRLPECAKSLAFALMYRAPDRTLNDEEVRKAHERMLAKVTERLGAEIRS